MLVGIRFQVCQLPSQMEQLIFEHIEQIQGTSSISIEFHVILKITQFNENISIDQMNILNT